MGDEVDSPTPPTPPDNPFPVNDAPGTTYNPYVSPYSQLDTTGLGAGSGTPAPSPGSGFNWSQFLTNPTLLSALAGTAGPLLNLGGQLAAGGQGPTATGQSNQFQNGSGTTNQSQTGFNTQSGTTNQTGTSYLTGTTNQTGNLSGSTTPVLDPRAGTAADQLLALLSGYGPQAQGSATNALSLMNLLAGQRIGAAGTMVGPAPSTSPTPSGVGDFPTRLPTDLDPALMKLVKDSFGNATGDIASQAITNARNRGFAGGADLLQTAAAPIAGPALAAVPAGEAKAYLDHVLQAYGLQSQNAAAQSAANANALNAGTNALMPGVQTYLGQLSAQNQSDANTNSLLALMLNPMNSVMQGTQGLISSLPVGSNTQQTQSQTGTTSQAGATSQSGMSNLSGTSGQTSQGTTTQNQTGGGNTSQVATTPTGSLVGAGLLNAMSGLAQGMASGNSLLGSLTPDQRVALLSRLMGAPA